MGVAGALGEGERRLQHWWWEQTSKGEEGWNNRGYIYLKLKCGSGGLTLQKSFLEGRGEDKGWWCEGKRGERKKNAGSRPPFEEHG